ncbi:Hypothetical predicted protein [Pelobates cultripes]|uniref:Uncharacterized protein n=1 Tax=Pelobates cultripes TaxID=61616 RepID=A0AAD1VUA0_PELCU|nr:Hypothetical predicted protein [Pelobates cultripes]
MERPEVAIPLPQLASKGESVTSHPPSTPSNIKHILRKTIYTIRPPVPVR